MEKQRGYLENKKRKTVPHIGVSRANEKVRRKWN